MVSFKGYNNSDNYSCQKIVVRRSSFQHYTLFTNAHSLVFQKPQSFTSKWEKMRKIFYSAEKILSAGLNCINYWHILWQADSMLRKSLEASIKPSFFFYFVFKWITSYAYNCRIRIGYFLKKWNGSLFSKKVNAELPAKLAILEINFK